MKRIMLDTNVYGKIIEKGEVEVIESLVEKAKDVLVYGSEVVRRELRDTPKKIAVRERDRLRNFRIYLLSLYRDVSKSREFDVTKEIKELAEDFFILYREFGGVLPREKIIDDFLIVATAMLHSLDVVVSEDNKSMVSPRALKAYSAASKLKKKRAPKFIGYEAFKELLRGSSDKLLGDSPKLGVFHIPLVLLPNLLFVHKNHFNNHKPEHIFKPSSAFKSGLLSFLLLAIFFTVPVFATHNHSVSHPANSVTNGTFLDKYHRLEVRL